MSHSESEASRSKQILTGGGIVLVVTVLFCGLLAGWRYLPSVVGEWIGTMVGIMTTPFFLEGSFVFIGLTIVIWLNGRRRNLEGDEFVYLEQLGDSDGAKNMPESARWAVYRQPPLPGETPEGIVQAEGAMAIGDWSQLAEILSEMSENELRSPEVLRLRIALARGTDNPDLAERLEADLAASSDQSPTRETDGR